MSADAIAALRRRHDTRPETLTHAERFTLRFANAAALRALGPVLAGMITTGGGSVVPIVNFAAAPSMTGAEAKRAAERMIAQVPPRDLGENDRRRHVRGDDGDARR